MTDTYDNEPEHERDWHQEFKDDRAMGLIDEHGNPTDPEPPEDYYDTLDAPDEPGAAVWSYSSEPPFPDGPPAPTDDLPDWPPF